MRSTGLFVHQGARSARLNKHHLVHFFPTAFMTKAVAARPAAKKDAVTTTAQETNDSSSPIWKEQHNRVQGAMWQHFQDDGTTRFTVSISRSYKDKDDDKWKSVHYFDRKDLKDVHLICDEAEEEILRLQNLTEAVNQS